MVVSGWALEVVARWPLCIGADRQRWRRTLQHAHPVPIVGLPPNMMGSVRKPLICLDGRAKAVCRWVTLRLGQDTTAAHRRPEWCIGRKKSPGLATRA